MTARTRDLVDKMVKAYDIRGLVDTHLDAAVAYEVGNTFATIMADEGCTTIGIGYDMRPSSPALAAAFADGVTAAGSDAVMFGLCATDELYFAAGAYHIAGAMFTASHNPAEYNGIKLCRPGAVPVSTDSGLATIAEQLVTGETITAPVPGTRTTRDILPDYVAKLRELVNLADLPSIKVAIDAGNGMAGHTAHAVFANTPVEVLPLYFELDGTFPNHEANPLDPMNLVDLQQFVRDSGADIGLAFDGDADRCFVVDEQGRPVSPSVVTALVAVSYLTKYPQAAIIHNLICSQTVPETIVEHGGRPVRTRVGHSYIKATMAEEQAVFGGEHSAHYYFTEFFNADSGMLAALHVLNVLGASGGTLSALVDQYQRYVASGEINTRLADTAQRDEKIAAVLDTFHDRIATVDRLDGVTVTLTEPGCWFNLRGSNTEPLLRLNAETPSQAQTDTLVAEIFAIIRPNKDDSTGAAAP
ncbi:phosphomannomutase/phosphoglucomutase [Corynebacterium choanae]|uniref:Phosphomannomutase/phosphoglucomutase n=1 Tax=Corynebacterium choanae TaxID=1862358 RepID=A0A3G6J7N6_9CORY|nr:phosphomannomutase/phosphoglucomutase [Corynebacterium choanae]AZA12908.1 Phosphomannomutase/phosphoglucomutase [Corynebacterium choanae]